MISFQITFGQEKYEPIPEANEDASKIELASNMVSSYFEAAKAGDHYDFSDIATQEFIEKMTPDIQKQTYEQLKQMFGDFESLTYTGSWKPTDKQEMEIIRFKGKFDKSEEPLEVRVVFNESNKISGFWLKPWMDDLNDSK